MHRSPSAAKPPVTLRPARQADFIAMFGAPPQHRARALAAEIEGRLVGLGGVALVMPGEADACEFWVCFMRATNELRARPVALHRAGLRMIEEARRLASAGWSRSPSPASSRPSAGSAASALRPRRSRAKPSGYATRCLVEPGDFRIGKRLH